MRAAAATPTGPQSARSTARYIASHGTERELLKGYYNVANFSAAAFKRAAATLEHLVREELHASHYTCRRCASIDAVCFIFEVKRRMYPEDSPNIII